LFALFERDRKRFEDLVTSPQESLANIYQELSLPDFEGFWQQASTYLDSIADYQKSRYHLTEEVRAKVNQRWGFFFQRYGYPLLPPLDRGGSVSLG